MGDAQATATTSDTTRICPYDGEECVRGSVGSNYCTKCGTPFPGCNLCDRDRKNNVWVEGPVDSNGRGGVCLLDTMTYDQVVGVLQVDEKAREDLRRVTSDPELHALADSTQRLSEKVVGDDLQSDINRNADSIPFYAIFRGQPPFSQ